MRDGQFDFWLDGQHQIARSGDGVRVPKGALPPFGNAGDTSARLIIVNAPGAIHDAFFTQLGQAVPEDSWAFPPPGPAPDIPAMLARAAALGVQIKAPSGA